MSSSSFERRGTKFEVISSNLVSNFVSLILSSLTGERERAREDFNVCFFSGELERDLEPGRELDLEHDVGPDGEPTLRRDFETCRDGIFLPDPKRNIFRWRFS
jgi:hypothetical protein